MKCPGDERRFCVQLQTLDARVISQSCYVAKSATSQLYLMPVASVQAPFAFQRRQVDFIHRNMYTERAVLGGEVAVPCNLQSALARLNSFPEAVSACRVCLLHVVLTSGSCAMGTHEPCQVRKEAALSGLSHVPRGSLG